jgi:amino acid transporter
MRWSGFAFWPALPFFGIAATPDVPPKPEPLVTTLATQPRNGGLLHILGVTFGIAVGVGQMIGSGILRSPSLIAASVPSEFWIAALWVLGALHAALGANVLAELATALPQAGGSYVYARRALGDIGGLIVGWAGWISTLAGIAAASVSFANFLAILWPAAYDNAALVAVAIQLALFAANIVGLREGQWLQIATSLLKALMLAGFAVAAVFVGLHASTPQIAQAVAPGVGVLALIGAYQMVRGAYAGWDAPVYFTEENADPARSIPRALFSGLVLTAVLYIGVNLALMGALGVAGTARSVLPFTTVLLRFGGSLPSILFAFGAMVTVASCANANIMSAPRILFAMSRDKLLPSALEWVNRGGSPVIAFAMSAVFSLVLAATGKFGTVFGLIGTLNSLAGMLVGIGFFVLRFREPDLKRPYRAVLYPVLPALAVVIDAVLLVLFLGVDRWGAYFAIGLSALCVPFALIARAARKSN